MPELRAGFLGQLSETRDQLAVAKRKVQEGRLAYHESISVKTINPQR